MTIYGVSGHQTAPDQVWRYVSHALDSLLGQSDDLIGLSSLAAGADQLFATAVLRHGGTLNVVIPCANYEQSFQKNQDLVRYRDLIAHADQVEQLAFPEPSEDAYLAAGQRITDRCDELIAAWDGRPAKGMGGTADIVTYARGLGKPVHVLWPAGATR